MKNMSFNAKRISMAVAGVPLYFSLAAFLFDLDWFGDLTQAVMGFSVLLVLFHFKFIGPTIEEIREYRRKRDLRVGPRRRALQNLPNALKLAILGLLAVPMLLSTAIYFGQLELLGRFDMATMAISLLLLSIANSLMRNQAETAKCGRLDQRFGAKMSRRFLIFILLNVFLLSLLALAFAAQRLTSWTMPSEPGTVFQMTFGVVMIFNIVIWVGLNQYEGEFDFETGPEE